MLSNEQAKQEAIKKAYGENYEKVKDRLVGSWYDPMRNETPFSFGYKLEDVQMGDAGIFRPIILNGLHDNNGWIRIEPDGSNLPTDGKKYDVWVKCSKFRKPAFVDKGNWIYESEGNLWRVQWVSHYKPITPEKPPVY